MSASQSFSNLTIGSGRIEAAAPGWRLIIPANADAVYADAQLDDYHGRRRRDFPHRPPRRLTVQARASHAQPVGTLGFGFWNDPFSLAGGVLAAPQVVWFFYASPPSDMALVDGVPGWGWKAATLNAGQWPLVVLAPAALVASALTRVPGLGRPVLAAARRAIRASETLLTDVALTAWHTYELDWQATEAIFRVNGIERLRAPAPPGGPLGFVAWIDNQYAVASRTGKFGFGVCCRPEAQWLELRDLQLTP